MVFVLVYIISRVTDFSITEMVCHSAGVPTHVSPRPVQFLDALVGIHCYKHNWSVFSPRPWNGTFLLTLSGGLKRYLRSVRSLLNPISRVVVYQKSDGCITNSLGFPCPLGPYFLTRLDSRPRPPTSLLVILGESYWVPFDKNIHGLELKNA